MAEVSLEKNDEIIKTKIRHTISISNNLESQLKQELELSGWCVSVNQFIRILLCRGLQDLTMQNKIGSVNMIHFTPSLECESNPCKNKSGSRIIPFPTKIKFGA